MGSYEQTPETNQDIRYEVVKDKDQLNRDIYFVIIGGVLMNLFATAQYSETITIPEGVTAVKSDAVIALDDFRGAQGLECGELFLPASLETIESNAFRYMAVDSMWLSPANERYTLKNGSLYTWDEKTLVLAAWPDGEQHEWNEHDRFYVAEGTEEIADGALDNIWFEKLMIPDSVVDFGNLAYCEAFTEDRDGECVVCASANSPAANYCKEKGIPYEKWK